MRNSKLRKVLGMPAFQDNKVEPVKQNEIYDTATEIIAAQIARIKRASDRNVIQYNDMKILSDAVKLQMMIDGTAPEPEKEPDPVTEKEMMAALQTLLDHDKEANNPKEPENEK